MRSVKDLMNNLGFRPDAPEASQRAFIKHLVRVANSYEQVGRMPKPETIAPEKKPPKPEPEKKSEEMVQLEFCFDEAKRVS